MLQMVAAGRCVCALPGWLVDEYASRLPITSLAIGKTGIHKHIYVGVREVDTHIPYVEDFIRMASATDS